MVALDRPEKTSSTFYPSSRGTMVLGHFTEENSANDF